MQLLTPLRGRRTYMRHVTQALALHVEQIVEADPERPAPSCDFCKSEARWTIETGADPAAPFCDDHAAQMIGCLAGLARKFSPLNGIDFTEKAV